MQKAEACGFYLGTDAFDIVENRWRSFWKGTEQKRQVKFLSVIYEGVLEVTNAEAFRTALISGIGRGKAYGMGLLTVMRRRRYD